MHTPGKDVIGTAWHEWENFWQTYTRAGFALCNLSHEHAKAIKLADLTALATERRDLLPRRATTPWQVLDGIEPVAWVYLNSAQRSNTPWSAWRDRFLTTYDVLDFSRNQQLGLTAQAA